MPERPSRRFTLREAQDVYLLIGECRAIGADGVVWRRHLVDRLREMWDIDIGFFADHVVVGAPGDPEGWIKPTAIIDRGWENDRERQIYWRYIRHGRYEGNPMFGMLASTTRIQVATRRDLMPDDAWYASPFYRDYISEIGLDDFIGCVCYYGVGKGQTLYLQRRFGREPIARRHVHLLRLICIELLRRQPQELQDVHESVLTTMPRRMLQTLACLLIGHTAKETAELLGVSIHTVQEHVKRLYKRSGTSNRAELADCYRDVAPILMAMSLEEVPDHQQQIDQAMRAPWPELPPASADEIESGNQQ